MRIALALLFSFLCLGSSAQLLKKTLKFATFYSSLGGSNSVADASAFSVYTGQLQSEVVSTPMDFSFTAGVRKIARFGYENRANVFYSGEEKTYSDAATVGKVKGFEFLFEGAYMRQRGQEFLNQNHFLRYVGKNFVTKVEYLQDGFADVEYFEASQRARINLGKKFSFNVGTVQRASMPYGYDPLSDWLLDNNNIHYTYLALQEGYNVDFETNEFLSPEGEVVANSVEVWEEVVIPQVLSDYVEKKISELSQKIEYSVVAGFDFYHYEKTFWLHGWGNVMPYHLNLEDEFSYHNFNDGEQWMDYSGGLIFGVKVNKSLGLFLEGRYNKYWNRAWHDFSLGINYVII